MIPITDEDLVSLNLNNVLKISLSTDNAEILQYMESVPRENWASGIHNLLEVGASVLNRVAASNNLDYIEKRFNDTAHSMEQFFTTFKSQLLDYLQENFDPDNRSDQGFIHKAVELVLQEHKKQVGQIQESHKLLEQKFNPNNRAGYIATLIHQIENFETRLDRQFNETDSASFTGQLRNMVENHFGEDGEVLKQIQAQMSLADDTPLAQVKDSLHKEIAELRDQLMQLKGQQELIEKTTIKGYPFEDKVFDRLQEIARPYSDLVEDTSLKAEAITGSKKGDYLYTLAASALSIAVDAKNYKKLKSLRAMLQYLNTAIEQRNAQIGIIVVPDRDSMQKQIGDWNFYEGNKIITTLEHLEISIKFAKYMMQLQHDAGSEVNVAEIRNSLEAVQQKMRDVSVLKSKLTKLSNGVVSSVEELHKMLDSLKADINAKLEDISTALH